MGKEEKVIKGQFNDKKIAIMTWYSYLNYGSVLQATALYNTVKKLGYNPDFVKYKPKGNIVTDHSFNNIIKRGFNKLKKKFNPDFAPLERGRVFQEYLEERATFTDECTSYSELNDLDKKYNAFICGSDQIWSPLCYDGKYFLDFVDDPNKMIAYAPSIGSMKIDNPIIRERMAKLISRFRNLSVREQQGADLINDLTGQQARVVLDPTLLMGAAEWDRFVRIENISKIDGRYILCYFLGDSNKYMGYVKRLSKRLNIPFYIIPITKKQKNSGNAVKFEVGPSEFVALIRNAVYVCTDSFHGMAFSINYNVPFSVFKRFKDKDPKNQNSRVFNLLKLLCLEERLTDCKAKEVKKIEVKCDFFAANNRLNDLRAESLSYLKNSLQSAISIENERVVDIPHKITSICCGCGACASVCVKGAISIHKNDEGFEHYFIDESKCVGCGQCNKVCPMTDVIAPRIKESKALYSVKSCSQRVLKTSSSGGVGYELATALLAKGYAVCGCRYDSEDNSAKHIWIMPGQEDKLSLLQGSKYIQSVSVNAIKQVHNFALHNKIAFFGTPCQIAAVDKILRKNKLRDKAILIDLICHGVPSYYLWEKYLFELDKKYGTGNHPAVLFRCKEREWRRRLLLVEGNGHIYKKEERKDDFYAFFRRGLCDMESCSDCPYRVRSAADLRIGDYWGDKFVYDKQGVSMVVANTRKGNEAIESLELSKACKISEQDLNEYWSVQFPYNPQRPLIREQLISELKDEKNDLHTLRKKYCEYYDQTEFIGRIVQKIKRLIKR